MFNDNDTLSLPACESSVQQLFPVVQLQHPVALVDLSPEDAKWDKFRSEADYIMSLYAQVPEYARYAERMAECSIYLKFAQKSNPETGESKLKLDKARFCRVPRCPPCNWRRQLMWRAKTFKVMPQILEDYPKAKFIFLTLTVRNCAVEDLRETINNMNKAWNRFTNRRNFPAIGFIKALEVTRSFQDDTAHPHFHCLLMVKPSYFTGNYYINQNQWTEMWKECLQINYTPIIHVESVKTSKPEVNDGMLHSVLETIKYSTKSSDFMFDDKRINLGQFKPDVDWLVAFTEQMYKLRTISTGGVFKKYLHELEKEPEDLIHADDIPEDDNLLVSAYFMFQWDGHIQRYLHRRNL
jgi:plasmid rolling circle replication initiator protein Rep